MLRLFGTGSTISNDTKVSPKKWRAREEVVADAENAAKRACGSVYQLHGFKHPSKVKFVTFGCQGSGNKKQKKVADHILKLIEEDPENNTPDFILLLGDNIYKNGANAADDEAFRASFYEPYKKLIAKGIPFFVITGNHDHNMRVESAKLPKVTQPEIGIARILHEVAHGYLPEKQHPDKNGLYQAKILDLTNLPAWNMPARYYALDAGDTRIICLDSSTYIADYLIKDMEGQNEKNNQALWLASVTKQAVDANKKCVLALHHPVYTPGKHALENDLDYYLKKPQQEELHKCFPRIKRENHPYNKYLKACFKAQMLPYDVYLSAHDHSQFYYNDGHTKQLTLGGGGGRTQKRVKFDRQKFMGFFIKRRGFGVVEALLNNPEVFDFDVYTVASKGFIPMHFKFTTASHHALQKTVDVDAMKLIAAIKCAVRNYLSDETNPTHNQHGVMHADDAWALTNEYTAHNYADLLKRLHNIAHWRQKITKPDEYSFVTFLNKAIELAFGKDETLESLHAEVIPRNAPRP